MRSKRFPALPVPVFQEAHRRYPQAVARQSLYAAAFFGHSHPHTVRTPESVWRGVVRQCLREYVNTIGE